MSFFRQIVWQFGNKNLPLQGIVKYCMLMRKKIFILSCLGLLALARPTAAMNMTMEMGVAEQVEERQPVLNTEGNSVTVAGGEGMTLEVVSLTGRAVATYKIESPAQRIDLNLPKGCYILKIGKVVRKVTVR